MANNIANYIRHKQLIKYLPSKVTLRILPVSNVIGIAELYGISFTGRWALNIKNFTDDKFLKGFSPYILFKDFDKHGIKFPI